MQQEYRKKVGLALGGGYARGIAHIGVLEVFEKEGIPIDLIAGTSIGALIGALYARKTDASALKKQANDMDWMRVTSLVDLTLPRSGFIGGNRVTSFLKHLMGDVDFSELKIPLSCIAADIITGDEIVINQGSVLEAVRASISIPIIFKTVKKDNRYLVDGGLVNPVPVSAVRDMGADLVIAVDVTPDRRERANYIIEHQEDKEPNIMQVMVQSIYIMTYNTAHSVCAEADTVIRPNVVHINPGDFHRGAEAVLEGELAAEDAMPHLKKELAAAGIPILK
jgi:NTE family protein